MTGQYLGNQFQGNVTPMKRPTFTAQPIYQKGKIIGLTEVGDTKRWTQLKYWIHKPTVQYPNITLCLSLVNAKGSIFCKLNDSIELKEIIDFLTKCYEDTKPIVEASASLVVQMKEQADKLAEVENQASNNPDLMKALASVFGGNNGYDNSMGER